MAQSLEDKDDLLDPYSLLNVPYDADFKTIKEKYFLYSRIFHPDKQASNLYSEARQQFEDIDRAYKAISNPFLKLIYDNFGYTGVRIHASHPNKFIDLEELYIKTEEQRHLHAHEFKTRLSELKKEIITRMNYLYERYREEKSYVNCYRNISLTMDLNGIEFANGPQPNRRHPPQFHLTRMSFVPTLLLPQIKRYAIQQEIGFVASASGFQGMQSDFNGGILYKANKRVPSTIKYIGDSDCKLTLFNSTKTAEGTLEMTSNPVKNLSITYSMRIGKFGVIPTVSMNRIINPSFSVNASTTLLSGGLADGNFGFVKLFPKQGVRIDYDARIADSEINNECLLSKDVTKKFSVLCGVVQKGEMKPGFWQLKVYACIGWKVNLNSHSFCEVRSCMGMGSNEILIRLKRNGLMTSIPITFGQFPSAPAVFYPLITTFVGGTIMYLYQRMRQNSKRLQLVMVKKQKTRLLDDRSAFNIRAGELQEKLTARVSHEILVNGLVILKAFGGESSKIKQIVKYYKTKQNAHVFKTQLTNQEAYQHALNYDIELPVDATDYLSEVLDITPFVQNCVKRSYIDSTYSEVVNQEGIFNPCIDGTKSTSAFIVYSYQGNVQGITISSGDRLRIGNISKQLSKLSILNVLLSQL